MSKLNSLTIDLPDLPQPPAPYIPQAVNPTALPALLAATTARLGVGRTGPRYTTTALLHFQADHAITQDALYREVDPALLEQLGLFTVETQITGSKQQYLLRPDLGRRLTPVSLETLRTKCTQAPQLQIVVGDGLSATAVEANVPDMLPMLTQSAQSAGLSLGTPFFVHHCRVGVLNDIGEALRPEVVILLIGERPGLGRAESLSAYLAYRPKAGDTDAERDVVCNIFAKGGTNPLEAAAYILQLVQQMRHHQASGVKLKLAAT